MARGVNIDAKIEQAKAAVNKAKDKYDAAVDELEKLMKKKAELQKAELYEAIAKSNKSYAEIMEFLNS